MASLADIFRSLVDDGSAAAFRAYDGSIAGPHDPVAVIDIRSPLAIRYVLSAPGELGLARAYVTGALDVRGDLHAALKVLQGRLRAPRPSDLARALRQIGRDGLRRAPVPAEEAPARWRRGLLAHSKRRDATAIAHHYDLSNRFYELLLGPSMAYSCAIFSSPKRTLEEAQAEKFDLVCRKLDLRPGQRLLDVGAGWGGMVMHAAAHYGVQAVGVTLSRQQARWARRAIVRRGLASRVEVRMLDYRDLNDGVFDAISSIGAMEHFGSRELGTHFASMAARLRPAGRMLNHCITRPSNRQRHRAGPFIDRYVFPDGELQGPGTVIAAMHDHGFEVRHGENLREHYAITLSRWSDNLERSWPEAVREVGERRARAWRLYLAASRVAFDLGQVQIHQVLGVRTDPTGRSGMPLRPTWERHTGEERVRALNGRVTTPAPTPPAAHGISA
ncbi:MAG TPA: cyclopropane-fatty-acyl-phospholipid synthase family protein [Solirubrobacteraceae bacterium]|nr:cyclopropane-fatty-acyl-phospholipid synthase family protein [Solirubrobacteraceae bacterium]